MSGAWVHEPGDFDYTEVNGAAQADTLPTDKLTEQERKQIAKAERRRKRDGIGFTAKPRTKGKGKRT